MADQAQNFTTTSTSSNNIDQTDIQESKLLSQSGTSNSTTQLLERNVKQIQIKEESTVKKVLKTREVKHFNASGEQIPQSEITKLNSSLTDDAFNDYENNPISENHAQPIGQNETFQVQPQQTNDTTIELNGNNDQNTNNQFQQDNPKNDEILFESRTGNQNSNYQNLVVNNNSANLTGLISNQNDHQQASQLPSVQPLQRTISRSSNIPPSGYEELDSTLGYNNQQPVRIMVNDPNISSYASKGAIHVQPFPTNPIMVQHDTISQNGVAYINQKSNYDIAYGTTGPVAQVPIISNNSNIYGTRSMPEPVYAINRNGNITFLAQSNLDSTDEVRWRNPELEEVISFLSSPDPMIRANSVAYLQHLSYADDHIKQRTRLLGGIPILIELLNRDMLEVQRNVCGALRNLSYGRKNDDNKRAIRDALGIQSLVQTLVNNPDNEIRELATSVLWNLSSCEDIKWSIVDDALNTIVSVILVPYTAWFKANLSSAQQFLPTASETHWSTVFRNATGVIRNISSAGAHARKQLRDCEGLVESLFFIINASISRNDVENKLVENCVCILRNLSYRCQETQDPDYDKNYYTNNNSHTDSATNSAQNSPSSPSSSSNLTTSLVGQVSSRVTDNLGCFSFARKTKTKSKSSLLNSSRTNSSHTQVNQSANLSVDNRSATLLPPHHPSNLQANGQSSTMVRTSTQLEGFNNSSATLPRSGISNINNTNLSQLQGKDLLWQPDVVKPYLALLSGCSNSETLEAAAGAIQNLAACYWQPSIDIRAAVRKERGLPVLVELLRMDRDRVVCVVATALRNLAIDQKNKELIGKYAMPDLVNKLSTGQTVQESNSSDDTIAAVLATLHEVISNNADFVRSLYESGGLNKLTYIVRNRSKYSVRVQRFAAQVSLEYHKRILNSKCKPLTLSLSLRSWSTCGNLRSYARYTKKGDGKKVILLSVNS